MAKIASDRPTVFLGCFGKHPGWNDHIDDIGVETEELAELKRLLYVQGVGGNIDAGSWEKLPESGRIDRFGHVFLWRRRGSLFFGRLWASTDGKGRSAYPMIVCAQSRGPGLAWVLKAGLPKLLELEQACRAAKTADEIRSAIERALATLRASASGAEEIAPLPTATKRMTEPGLLGETPEALDRVLYIVRRELKVFMPAKAGSTTVKSVDARPQHLRVPRAEPTPEAAVALWGRFIAEHTGKGTPILAMAPVEHPWVDLVVGEPDEPQFLCMLASASTIPPVTEVPYTIDEQHRDSGRAMLDRSVESGSMDPAEDRASLRETVSGIGAGIERIRAKGEADSGVSKRTIVFGALLAVVVVFAIVMLIVGGGRDQEEAPSEERPPAQTRPPATPQATETPAAPSEEAAARWEALCVAYERWFLDFAHAADRELMADDDHLSTRVLPVLDRADEWSPASIHGRGAPGLEQLRVRPPSRVWTPEAVDRTREALEAVAGVRTALQTPAWPARAELEEAAARLHALGWNAGADELRRYSAAIDFESGERLASGVERVLGARARVGVILGSIGEIESVGRLAEQTGDPVLGRLPSLIRGPGADGQGRLSEAEAKLERARGVAAQVAAFIENEWPRVDPEALQEGAAEVYQRASGEGATPELFYDWLAAAGRDIHRLPDTPDPREGWQAAERIASLSTQLDDLVQRHADAADELVAGTVGELDQASALAEAVGQKPWRRATAAEIAADVERVDAILLGIDRRLGDAGLRLSRDHAEFIEALRETASVSQTGSEAIDQAWTAWRDDLLSTFPRPEDRLRLAENADAARDLLGRIEREAIDVFSGFQPPHSGGGIREDSVRRLLNDRRERLIRSGVELASWDAESGHSASMDRRWADRVGQERDRVGAIRRHLEDAAEIERLLESGASLNSSLDDGRSISEVRRAWDADEVATDLRPAMEPLLQTLDRIDRIAAMTDPAELVPVVSEGRGLSVPLAAWRRLAEVRGWPGPADLAAEIRAQDRLGSLAREIEAPAERQRVLAELEAGAAARWRAAMEKADTPAGVREAIARRAALGGRVEDLPFAPRFNASVQILQARLDEASDDEAALGALGEFVETIGGQDAIERLDPDDRAWLQSVIDLASGEEVGPSIDFGALGPGRAGWSYEADVESGRVNYTHPDGQTRLSFVGVSLNGTTVFVGMHEISVEVFARTVGDVESQAALRDLWPALADAMAGGVSDRWRGPRSWAWDPQQGVVPNSRWLSWDEATGPAYPQGLVPPRPTPDSPMQMVSFEAATAMAEAAGCRLPTTEEWRRALEAHESTSATDADGGAAWNLRGRVWSSQLQHALDRDGQGLSAPWPDAGAFVPRGVAEGRNAGPETGHDDGVLWFEPVGAARGTTLRHMVGNVAEWVVSPETRTGQAIIGGSALSDRSLPVDEPFSPPPVRQQSFSDVGFRLAFGFEGELGGSVRATAEQFLRTAPFLKP